MNLNDDIKNLKGVGLKRAELLNRMNINTVYDLLYFFPRKYEDRRIVTKIMEAEIGKDVLLEVKVITVKSSYNPRSKNNVVRILCEDNTGSIELLFFNTKYVTNYFKPGDKYTLFGKISLNYDRKQMSHPEFHKTGSKDDLRCLYPIYPLTKGLTQSVIRSMINSSKEYFDLLTEWLPKDIIENNNLCSLKYALNNIHFPTEERPILEGRYRLVFEELLTLQTGLFYIKSGIRENGNGIKFNKIDLEPFINSLKFNLTEGQLQAIQDIKIDLEDIKSMNRLIQGDVGSGKTVIAEVAMYDAYMSHYQSVMMAPTEILAKQHYNHLKNDFEAFGIKVAILIGSQTKKEKDDVLLKLKNGEIDILIGTHAIIEPGVEFNNLGLVITDEQHRFGVNQRALLTNKGNNPNVLVMTATPIPRTLAVILYGDLDISQIKTLPKGRIPIKTYLRDESARDKIYNFIENEVKNGRQAYIVCPLITESENIDCKSAEETYLELSKKYKSIKFGLIHGALKDKEKDEIFEKFLNKEIDVLVSTVVIEVGVDVPNATTIVIENAERFGLAQLHQLRGRVGRSNLQSYCILISYNESKISRKRNEIMCQSNDGFYIAEEDLKLRGPGEIFGTKQHGIPELHISDLIKNIDILEKVKIIAADILLEDPSLSKEKNIELRNRIKKLFGENISLKI